mgnify:FL=1
MATSLRDNLTSSYFNAAHKLYPKKARRRIIAYVESYDDIAFWRTLLEEFEDDEHYFQVMLPSATSLAKGKKDGTHEHAEYCRIGEKSDCLCGQ